MYFILLTLITCKAPSPPLGQPSSLVWQYGPNMRAIIRKCRPKATSSLRHITLVRSPSRGACSVASHPLRMRKALGSNLSVSILFESILRYMCSLFSVNNYDRQYSSVASLVALGARCACSACCAKLGEAQDSASQADRRQRGDSNPCGQSPMDFESISLAARTHCLLQYRGRQALLHSITLLTSSKRRSKHTIVQAHGRM